MTFEVSVSIMSFCEGGDFFVVDYFSSHKVYLFFTIFRLDSSYLFY